MPNLINIWQTQSHNYVNGPSCRFVIWVQGCHLACPECWNKHTWSFEKSTEISVDALFEQIAITKGISGITLSGGEPFIQAKNLYKLVKKIKNELGLNLQIFTGYERYELTGKYQKKLLELTDILVAGRFDTTQPNNNQKVYEFGDIKWQFNNTNVEIDIDAKGDLVITGYPPDELIKTIKETIK